MGPTTRFGLRLAFIAVYCVAGAEAYLRIFNPQSKNPRYVVASPLGIRANEPDRVYQHSSAEYRIEFRINSQGMRADEVIPYEKPEGVQRILILGDSFGIGYGANIEDSFLGIMERKLTEAGKNIEIVNTSVSGLGPAEQLIILRNEGLRFDPDLVLHCWNITDIDDNVRAALFALNEHGGIIQIGDTYLPGTAVQERMGETWLFQWLSTHSDLFAFARENLGARLQGVLARVRSANGKPASREADTPGEPAESSPMLSYAERLALALLDEIRRESEAHGATFMICDVPAHWARFNYWSTFPADSEQANHGFHFYSPVDTFNELKADQVRGYPGEKIYWERSCGHFAPLGNQIVGEGLAEYILQHGLLDGPPASETKAGKHG